MSENKVRVSDMLRTTAANTNNLLLQIADHIDKLEEQILVLGNRINELEGSSDADRNVE